MDRALLGQRLADARVAAGLSQGELGSQVELDRTAISRLESGDRKLNVLELVRIAEILDRPLAHFVADPEPSVVSRRSSLSSIHAHDAALDLALDGFASDARLLMSSSLLPPMTRPDGYALGSSHDIVEDLAQRARTQLGLGHQPVDDLGWACQRLGLLTYAAPLGADGPDGACVEVAHEDQVAGVAVINGDRAAGRRRMTLAHELGHWLTGDAYDGAAPRDGERWINSFAIHFLAPRSGVVGAWERETSLSIRDRLLTIGAEFRLSWTATVGQASNLGLIATTDYEQLKEQVPTRGDYLRLQAEWTGELVRGYLSPSFVSACLTGFTHGILSAPRTLELLRGMLAEDDLPTIVDAAAVDWERIFADHDG